MQNTIALRISALTVLCICISCIISSCCANKTPTTQIGISDEYLYFPAKPGNEPKIITITGVDEGWSFSINKESEDWIYAELNKSENNSLSIQVSLNVKNEEREGCIIISSGNASKTVRIVQGAANIAPETITESFRNGYSYYSGDSLGLGIGLHSLVFAPDNVRFINPASGYEMKNGIQLIVGFTSDFYKIGSSFRLKSGKYYTSDNNKAANTIIQGKNNGKTTGSYIQIYKDGKIDKIKLVKQGSLEIRNEGESYVFTFDFTLNDGVKFIAEYRGDFKIRSLLLSTLTKDCDVTNLTKAKLDFTGQDYISGLNKWDISLMSEGLNVDPNSGLTRNGDFIHISLLTPVDITDGVPYGQYDIYFDDKPYFAIAGYLKKNNFKGCWYIKISDNNPGTVAPLINGYVDIGRAEAYYIIKVNGMDDRGNRITASFVGIPASDKSNNNASLRLLNQYKLCSERY